MKSPLKKGPAEAIRPGIRESFCVAVIDRQAIIDTYAVLIGAGKARGLRELEQSLQDRLGIRSNRGRDVAALYLRVHWDVPRCTACEIGVFLRYALLLDWPLDKIKRTVSSWRWSPKKAAVWARRGLKDYEAGKEIPVLTLPNAAC